MNINKYQLLLNNTLVLPLNGYILLIFIRYWFLYQLQKVYLEGLSSEPIPLAQMKKKKVFDAVSKKLKTGEGGIATWDGKVITTSSGPCAAASLVGAPIS